MNIRSILPVLLLLLYQLVCPAQEPDKKVLMTVAGREVEAGEFIRMFKKNIDSLNKTKLNNFLEQFIAFKLKVADAMAEGYDTTKAYRDELNGYRKQLAQTYLTDNDIKEKLIQKAYERSLNEVKVSHILISCAPNAAPADTARAYAKALETRKRILQGEPFENVARSVSDDKSVLLNNGNLGYFTVFQMITPFEDAAYNLNPGSLSMPVRTSFGYHIILVVDKRPSRGKVRVAHIMKAAPEDSNDTIVRKAGEEIGNIYLQLKNGGSFRELAAKYSDHKESAAHGGEINMFGVGEMIPEFAEAAFAIKDTGEYSEPVRTVYGFHIIKLLERKDPATYEEAKPYLESKINQANLNLIGTKSLMSRLKKEYNFRVDTPVYKWFISNTDTLIIRGKSHYIRRKLPLGNIFSFADKYLTSVQFADFLERQGYRIITGDPVYFIKASLETASADEIVKYEDSMLEQKYPDFRYLMKEYHDGILLFEISSKKIWNKVGEDSTGLKDYYENHRNSFVSKKGIEAKIYALKQSDSPKKLESAYKRYSSGPDTDIKLRKKFNNKGDTMLVITEGKWFEGDDPELDSIPWNTGVQSFSKDGAPCLIVINKVIEPVPLPFSEIKAEVLTGYQDWLTREWIGELTDEYPVKIDDLVFEEVKKRINHE